MEAAGMDVRILHNRPDALLAPDLHLLLRQFIELSRQRPPAFSNVPAAIPISQIEAFHRVYGVGEYMELEPFATFMIELDNTLLDHYVKKAEQEERRPKKITHG